MSDFEHAPEKLLCLHCGTWTENVGQSRVDCGECGRSSDTEQLVALYQYAAEAHYYGVQYRDYYERAFKEERQHLKPSLAFAGEIFGWIMLAALSGVVGNASYDAIRAVISRIIADGPKQQDRDYSALLTLSDDEVGRLIGAARDYYNNMQDITDEVRSAIIEEIVADTVAHDPELASRLLELMAKKPVKPKHRKKFAELVRVAVLVRQRRQATRKPQVGSMNGLWSKTRK